MNIYRTALLKRNGPPCKTTGYCTIFKAIPFLKLVPHLSYIKEKNFLNIYRRMFLKGKMKSAI